MPSALYMERFGQVFYIFLQRLLPKLEVFALFPQCFGHPLGLFTLCHDFIPFLLQRLKFLLPGLSFVSRCFEMFLSEDTPRSMPRTSAQIVCISMASSDVVLILFRWNGRTSRTLYGHGGSVSILPLPMPLVLMDGNLYRCHPEPLLESFPKFLQFFHGRILFDHDHALTERFRLSPPILRPVFSLTRRIFGSDVLRVKVRHSTIR